MLGTRVRIILTSGAGMLIARLSSCAVAALVAKARLDRSGKAIGG